MPWYYRVRTAINTAAPSSPPPSRPTSPFGERHPKEAKPSASPTGPSLPNSQSAPGGFSQARSLAPHKEALALHRQQRVECSGGAAGPGASHHRLPGVSPPVGLGHRLDLLRHSLCPPARGYATRSSEDRRAQEGASVAFVAAGLRREDLSPNKSQNQIEQEAILAV